MSLDTCGDKIVLFTLLAVQASGFTTRSSYTLKPNIASKHGSIPEIYQDDEKCPKCYYFRGEIIYWDNKDVSSVLIYTF